MREQLVALLQERVGLSQDQAEQVVDVVMQYLQQQGPEQLKALLGSSGGFPDLGNLLGR